MAKYTAKWGSDTIEISANFAEASCPVKGTNGRQVADFRHSPAAAMRHVIETEAQAEGLDLEDDDTIQMIDHAVNWMSESK